MASIELLTVTTMTESFILFDNEYKQHSGVPMGSPQGPILLLSFYVYTKFFGLKNVCLNLDK